MGLRNAARRKSHGAILILGLMLGTALISASLGLGDSLEHHMEQAAYRRLGEVDLAVTSHRFFNESLFEALVRDDEVARLTDHIARLIVGQASLRNPGTGQTEPGSQLVGFGDRFLALGGFTAVDGDPGLPDGPGLPLRVFINERGANELELDIGNTLELSLPDPAFSWESIYDSRTGENMVTLTATVTAIVADEGLGCFDLTPGNPDRARVFMDLERLQDELDQKERINTIVISNIGDRGAGVSKSSLVRDLVISSLDEAIGAREAGLVVEMDGYVRIISDDIFLADDLLELLRAKQDDIEGLEAISPTLVYFVSSMMRGDDPGAGSARDGNVGDGSKGDGSKGDGDAGHISYSTVAGIDLELDSPFGPFLANDTGEPFTGGLEPGEMLITNWTAGELGVGVGESVTVSYLVLNHRFELATLQANFTVKGIVKLEGKAHDEALMPRFEGIEGMESCSSWDPPFPIDMETVTDADIDYWQEYKGTPKAYIDLQEAQGLWGNDLGELTALKLKAGPGSEEELAGSVMTFLDSRYGAREVGISVRTVKEDALSSAERMDLLPAMFMAFSTFAILAGLLLAASTFGTLALERQSELGVCRALGFKQRDLTVLLVGEGVAYAALASISGAFLGLLLTLALIRGADGVIDNAAGGTLTFHYELSSLLIAIATGLAIALLTLVLVAHLLGRRPIVQAIQERQDLTDRDLGNLRHLGGGLTLVGILMLPVILATEGDGRYLPGLMAPSLMITGLSYACLGRSRQRFAHSLGGLSLLLYTLVFSLGAFGQADVPLMGLFVLSGLMLVLGGLLFTLPNLEGLILRFQRATAGWCSPALKLSLLYPTRRLGRAALTVSLNALVLFLMISLSVTVAVQERGLEEAARVQGGGHDIVGETTHPVYLDLTDPTQLDEAGIEAPVLGNLEIQQARKVGQEGATCSNLDPGLSPALLGVSAAFWLDSDFQFQSPDTDDPARLWALLDRDMDPIPVFVDHNTLRWLLQGELGSVFEIQDQAGQGREVVVVGIIRSTILTATFIMSEANLDRLYPTTAAYRYYLFKVPSGAAVDQVARQLESELFILGMDTETVLEAVKRSMGYEHSFIALFQAFLALGLVMGLGGLGMAALRSVIEREREVGILRALGFDRKEVLRMFMFESSFIATMGILVGVFVGLGYSWMTFSVWDSGYRFTIPWLSVTGVVIAVLCACLLAAVYPALRASRRPPAEALRWIG